MKQFLFTVLSVCILSITNAQTPQGMNYQGVARNASGVELPNQPIGLELSILDGSPTGTAVYTETHALTTDASGLFSLVIGNGTPSTGTFAGINWATGGSKWLKTSMDITGGTSYQLIGTTQLMSVPYALYAENVANNGGKQTLVLSDDVTDAEAVSIIASEFGPNTQELIITGTTNLTTVNLPMFAKATYIEVSHNAALTTLNLGGLTKCSGSIVLEDNINLANLDLSSLTKISSGEFRLVGSAVNSLNLSSLVRCNANLYISANQSLTNVDFSQLSYSGYMTIDDNDNLINLSFPALLTFKGTNFMGNDDLLSVSFPILTTTENFLISSSNSLTSISAPALINSSNINIIACPTLNSVSFLSLSNPGSVYITGTSLTSISFPALSSFAGGFTVRNSQLTVSTVNSLLASLVAISPPFTGFSIDLSSQTPLAPPSGQGITDKNTLISNGNTVATD